METTSGGITLYKPPVDKGIHIFNLQMFSRALAALEHPSVHQPLSHIYFVTSATGRDSATNNPINTGLGELAQEIGQSSWTYFPSNKP